MNSRQTNVSLILLGLVAVLSQFQNCSDVTFTGAEDSLTKSCLSNPNDPSCSPSPVCEPGFTLVDGQCIQTSFNGCLSFVELNTDVIPSLESTGVCYYKKLIDASPVRTSGSLGEVRAPDVLSRRHCPRQGESPNVSPYVLGDNQLDLTFLAQRNVSLTSSRVGNVDEIAAARLKVDNYILAEVYDSAAPPRRLARGTGDSVPHDGPIRVNGEAVTDFISYAPNGTAEVDVIDITQNLSLDILSSIRVRMLDCGCSANTSDMYIIIH